MHKCFTRYFCLASSKYIAAIYLAGKTEHGSVLCFSFSETGSAVLNIKHKISLSPNSLRKVQFVSQCGSCFFPLSWETQCLFFALQPTQVEEKIKQIINISEL